MKKREFVKKENKMNRRTPKEIIEQRDPETEQSYIKFPRQELIKISKRKKEKQHSVSIDPTTIDDILSKNKLHNKYALIHTHYYDLWAKLGKRPAALPSGEDLKNFYNNSKEKEEIIAQRNVKTGKFLGYTILLKGKDKVKDTNLFEKFKEIYYDLKNRGQFNKYDRETGSIYKNPEENYNRLKGICEKQNWGLRFVPAKGYYFNKETGNFEKKKGIEKKVASLIGGFIIVASLLNLTRVNAFVISENVSSQSKYFILIFIISTLIFGAFMIFKNLGKNKLEKLK